MGMQVTQRPGVFSQYAVTSSLYGARAQGCCALVALAAQGTAGDVVTCTDIAQVRAVFGDDANEAVMVRAAGLLFQNGVSKVAAVRVSNEADTDAYRAIFELLGEMGGIDAIVCGAVNGETAGLLKDSVESTSGNGRERIAVLAGDETVAQTLNSERVCVIAPQAIVDGQADGLFAAAAVAACIVSTADKAANVAGVRLAGLEGVENPLTEAKLGEMLAAGVSVIEPVAGGVELVRAVSSRTATDGQPDGSYRSIMTVITIDTVLVAVRNRLRGLLRSARSDAVTLGAIATQAAVVLGEQRDAGYIDSFAAPVAKRSTEDPAVCTVGLSFAVAVGLNQIHITADIMI